MEENFKKRAEAKRPIEASEKPYDGHPEVERGQVKRLVLGDIEVIEAEIKISKSQSGWSPLHRKQQKFTTAQISAGIVVGHTSCC